MKCINLSELFRQTDWPQTLTQQQHQKLMQDKIDRAHVYRLLQGVVTDRENMSCPKPVLVGNCNE